MAFELRSDKTVAKNILRLARQRLENAVEALIEPPADKATAAVHAARKEFKRLRALLRLARPALGRKRFDKENAVFRDAGRALAAVRDAQALVAAFDKLIEPAEVHERVSAEAAAQMRNELARDLATAEQETALPARLPAVLGELEAARKRVKNDWPLHGDDWRLVGDGLRAVYREGRRALERVQAQPGDDARWHELRKRVKDLGYAVRVLRPLWPHALKGLGRDLDALADALGDDHDLVVLRARLLDDAKQSAMTPAESGRFADVIDARRAELHAEARTLAQRIYEEKPREFADRLKGYWKIWRKERSRAPATNET